ncbi:MAG: GDSL-type esterase/lipase family protein, partial [Bacteroidales bacterium]|nr:GDSL-type esterase/lipase family protein [Bacteroidales bacterium]
MIKSAFENSVLLWVLMLALLSSSCTQKEDIQVFVAGDSTAQSYRVEQTLMRGWAQYLELFFDEQVQVENRSMAGRSTKSFREEGRWNKILEDLHKGDVVFIQFGHNDTSTKPERHASPADY